jgi:hypothetical protein
MVTLAANLQVQWDASANVWPANAILKFPMVSLGEPVKQEASRLHQLLMNHLTGSRATMDQRLAACLIRLVQWLEITKEGGLLHGASLARCMMKNRGTLVKLEGGLSWHEGLQDVNEGPLELLAMVREYLESQGLWPDDDDAAGAPGVATPLGVPLGWTADGHRHYNIGVLNEFGVNPNLNLMDVEWAFNLPALLTERRWELQGPNTMGHGLTQWFLQDQSVAFLMEMSGRVVWRLRVEDNRVSGHWMSLTLRQTATGVQLEPGQWKVLQVHLGGVGTNQVQGGVAVEASGRKFMLALKMQNMQRAGICAGEPFIMIQTLGLPDIFPEP